MILTGFLVAFLLACSAANESASDDEIPFLVASQSGSEEGKASNLLPDASDEPPLSGVQGPGERGRSDIEIEEERPFGGYFYPKPSKPFYLPPFKALGAEGTTQFAEDGEEVARPQRSPQRWRPQYRPQYQPPPPFIPGFIPPSPIRPLPALYGRPAGY